MNFFNKIKWVLGVLMVFVLIIATNLIDRNNFLKVKNSVSSMYEDRLLVKGLIFELNNHFHDKEIAYLNKNLAYFNEKNQGINDEIMVELSQFKNTGLTREEKLLLATFESNIQELIEIEKSNNAKEIINIKSYPGKIESLKQNLKDLSEIQINEGKRQMVISQRAIDSVELFTHLEIYVLIILALVIQIIIIYQPKEN